MNALIFVVGLVVVGCVSGETYTDRYDNINLDEILENRRLLVPYIKCVLDKGKCTAEGRELKSHLTDALQTGCSKCTEAQKNGARRVINHLIQNEPDYWKQLVEKYDPKREHSSTYEKDLKATA